MDGLNILIVEDDENLAASVAQFLSPIGNTTVVHDGFEGQMMGQDNIYDIAILDLMLPEVSGYDILKHWRVDDEIDMPVLILTAKDTMADKVHGFELGADDYLTKPFHREELILRVKALLKRTGRLGNNNSLSAGEFNVDLGRHYVEYQNQELKLNGKEYDLLVYFMQNPSTIITKDQIFDRLWGFDSETSLSVVEVYMSNLRKKIKQISGANPIKTLRNVGYMLEEANK
ncbi:response regulator transcription factor [Lactobacillus kunkeei]|uniref:Response regulator transcription factor n=1 Tax=Apilactobacillus nanyangensis TaxID=2799579 RepID=A0ABT0HYT0_9LACO|nr:response regulator transcription factor [Apilactobacillus nanyangensis]MBC6389165.1 response regulator transcription factor [Apilactobacillus kunkeei]MCK8612079.1 response regulator transcription factor [Apilactobacillus nanyangensis]TMT02620.1 response regulator transcription factor [Apilactobacillus kunkeei]TMT04187.1 response regulator transcription factor [Apilactobacillus kunkeei]